MKIQRYLGYDYMILQAHKELSDIPVYYYKILGYWEEIESDKWFDTEKEAEEAAIEWIDQMEGMRLLVAS